SRFSLAAAGGATRAAAVLLVVAKDTPATDDAIHPGPFAAGFARRCFRHARKNPRRRIDRRGGMPDSCAGAAAMGLRSRGSETTRTRYRGRDRYFEKHAR